MLEVEKNEAVFFCQEKGGSELAPNWERVSK
jgi:hypothetical protein